MSEEKKEFTGTTIWFAANKGYGFIARDDGGKDLFVHYSNIVIEGYKTLEAGQKVAFEIGANHKGEQAVNVRSLSAPAEQPNA